MCVSRQYLPQPCAQLPDNTMIIKRILPVLLLLITASWLARLSHAAEFPEQSRVLVIYGNPDIGPWEQNFNEIILENLATEAAIPVIPEFLDLIQATVEDQRVLAESLRLKYSRLQIDLVVAVLPEANSFVFNWVEVFAPQARVLHVVPGLDVSQASQPLANSQIIETSLATAMEQTLELIPRLLPETDHIYLIGGASEGDQSYLQRFESTLQQSAVTEIPYTVLSGLTPVSIVQELADASPDGVIIMSTYDRDNTGSAMRTMAVNQLLADNIPLPIFSVFDTLLTSGTLGGNVSSSTLYANTSSRVAVAMLDGEPARPPIYADTGFLFNGGLLDRFEIDRSLLPPDSEIVNDSPDLWRDYSNWIILGLTIIVVQLALISALVFTIRRRKLAESELKRVQKMEALGSLSGGIAHDFNNILMSIMANAELLSLRPGNQEMVRSRVDNILNASERARDLIAQILMFSRQSASFEAKPVSLITVVNDCLEQLRAFMPADCNLEFTVPDSLPAINGDASQLEQVVTNLCVNAQHAMTNGGTIRLSTAVMQVEKPLKTLTGEIPQGEYVLLKVQDTGSGIAAEDLQHVFEPFYTTKPRGKGTGLGLAMVYQMLKAHGAYIDLQSHHGKGTTAALYFPLATDKTVLQENQNKQPAATGNGERILLVDDDEMVLEATRQTLQALGYRVAACSSPRSALDAFQANQDDYDLIFTDLTMPEMDGVRLIASIRLQSPYIPAVICSGYSETLSSKILDDLTILRKPSSLVEIGDAVQEALRKSTVTAQ